MLTADQLFFNQTIQKEKPVELVAMGIVDVPGIQKEQYVSPGKTASHGGGSGDKATDPKEVLQKLPQISSKEVTCHSSPG